MISTLLGIKKNMSLSFDRFGRRMPVTIIQAEPNVVVFQKNGKIQLGLGQKKKAKKTDNLYLATAGSAPRFIKEIKIDNKDQAQAKVDKVTVSIFEPGDEVKITGVTKGKGFAGVVKRWGFAGGPKTHGQSDRHRSPGSIGQTTTPGRVFKGKKMAGHLGSSKFTVTGLEVIDIDSAKNLLTVKGPVPGAKNGFVIIEKTGKVKSYTPPPPPKEEEKTEKEKEKKQESEVKKSDENNDQLNSQGNKEEKENQ